MKRAWLVGIGITFCSASAVHARSIAADSCVEPEIGNPSIVAALNSKLGQFGGPQHRVQTLQAAAPVPPNDPAERHSRCHGTLIFADGGSEVGLLLQDRINGAISWRWHSDEELVQGANAPAQKKLAAQFRDEMQKRTEQEPNKMVACSVEGPQAIYTTYTVCNAVINLVQDSRHLKPYAGYWLLGDCSRISSAFCLGIVGELGANAQVCHVQRSANRTLLVGKLFDDRGNRMSPTYSTKKGIRYRYYICRLLIEGRKSEAGTLHRIPAVEIEERLVKALKALDVIPPSAEPLSEQDQTRRLIDICVARVIVEQTQIVVKLTGEIAARIGKVQLEIPWHLKSKRPKREILLPHTDPAKDGRPVRSEVRVSIVKAVALGRQWLSELVSGQVLDTEALAAREQRSKRSIHMLISMTFVAPDIIEALVAGRLPRGIGITRLADLPPSWAKQRQMLGISRLSLRGA